MGDDALRALQAWKAAHRAALEIYRETGASKRGTREFRRFLDLALGSLAEVSYLQRFSRDYGLLSEKSWLGL